MQPRENDDDFVTQVVEQYWKQPYPRTRAAVAKALREHFHASPERLSEKQLGTWLRDFERAGRVSHLVHGASGNYAPMMPRLEDTIRRKFKLRDVVVLDLSWLKVPTRCPEDQPVEWNNYDDEINDYLGVWAGRQVSTILKPGAVVACGGGRALYATASHCWVPHPDNEAFRPKTVVSLTGNMSTTSWGEPLQKLDADLIAALLAGKISACDIPRRVDSAITRRNSSPPDTSDVTLAIVGIGALGAGTGHRLWRHKGIEELKSVAGLLDHLENEIKAADPDPTEPPFLHWIGDLCNFLFVVAETSKFSKKLAKSQRKSLETIVAQLNDQFLNTRPTALADICKRGAVLAVSGGPHKFPAIAHVLIQKDPWITHLVTDRHVAEQLEKLDTP